VAFRWTKSTQSVPLNGSSVNQRTMPDTDSVVTPAVYNHSLSGGSAYVQITTATTTADIQVSSTRPVRLCKISLGGGTMGQVDIYDALTATGTPIWSGTPSSGDIKDLQIPLQTGLTVVTAAATKLTITLDF
jgi:hypothetical protein